MAVRDAVATEVEQLARVWFDAWTDAHASILPQALVRLRTLEGFRTRLQARLSEVRVVGEVGDPLGLCILKGSELDQLFVARAARGSGVAAALIDDAERRLRASGVQTAWLSCAIGNDRAVRFYEKCGWRRVGTMIHQAETADGHFPLETWRFEKVLALP